MALALAGGTDLILGWWPLELGSREWRFATIHQTISGSPLLVLGVGMALSAALALGTRWAVIFFGGAMVALGFLVSVGLIAFAMDVPLALEVATGPAAIGIRRVIWKTLAMGMVLGCFLLVGGSLALWRLRTFR